MLRLSSRPLPLIGRARVYVCGITPYETTHLGHAATFVWSDLAVRVLRELGLDVTVARNITDVDDDLLAEARARGTSWRSLATQQTYRFEDDVTRLGCAKPTFEPMAHNYVDEVILLTKALLDAGRAYERKGNVYFRGADVHAGAGIARAEALRLAAERGGDPDDPDKDDPLDVAVWQRSGDDDPAWASPWGKGRPGWHAECAAMALATLGTGIDLHAGGSDLAFPHHAYEAAHAEAALGVAPFARAWLRVGTVRLEGEKMAKSTRNLVFVHDLLERWPGEALRLLVLDRRWWDDWDYAEAGVAAAAARLDRLRTRAAAPGGSETGEEEVMAALLDDLDVPRALEVAEESGGDAARRAMRVLGLDDVPPLPT
ncbi:MAG TPA: cysteine--tRNA ligase [Acidimicrobiales bacterium]|nr:cysteine--tRNA ligase [Acidimicrobiales bacterium]